METNLQLQKWKALTQVTLITTYTSFNGCLLGEKMTRSDRWLGSVQLDCFSVLTPLLG